MRRFILILVIFYLSGHIILAKDDDWHIIKSTHFIIYYKNAKEEFLERLIEKAEDYYDEIADDLGFRRHNFWLWDNRAKIYIYDEAKSYQVATGQPIWSGGSVIPRDKIIHTFVGQNGFFDITLPHEMGHIIFREFVGFDNPDIPFWLDEGVASYQGRLRRITANRSVKEAIKKSNFITLEKLSQINPILTPDSSVVNLFYSEALSIIDYLIKEFGKDNFVLFCQNLRDKRNLERALASSYPFKNLQELERTWQRYLINE